MTFTEICEQAIERWGVNSQLDQAIEEAAELIQAINKFKRYGSPHPLVEEMVDLQIMMGQLKVIVCQSIGISNRSYSRMVNEIWRKKLKRVEGLLMKEGADDSSRNDVKDQSNMARQ